MMLAHTTLTLSRERRRNTVAQEPRAFPTVAMRTMSLATTLMSRPLDARIDRRLDHVDHQIEEHEEQREHQDGALQQRQVALEDRRVQEEAGAGPGEYRLDED